MVKITSYDRYFTVHDGIERIGLKRGDASYKITGDNLKLFWVDDWFYKNPIKTMDLPIEIDGQVYDRANIDEGLVVIFPEKQSGGSGETITVDDALSTTSENPVQNKVITNALNDKASNNDVEEALTTYTYDKATIDDKIAQGGSFDPTQYYNKTQTDALLNDKANTATTYTKAEVDALIANFVTSAQVQSQLTAYTYDKQTIDEKIESGVTPSFEGKAKLTLNDGSIVTISGSGELTSAETSSYKSSIVSVEIGSACTSIGDSAFFDCPNLTTAKISDSVQTIRGDAFNGNSNLKDVNIGGGITNIGFAAFQMSFEAIITIKAVTPPILELIEGEATQFSISCPIYVPAASVDAYKTASGWSKYASKISAIS